MRMTNLSFIYLILPLSLFVFYAVPPKARGGVLLAVSLLYYALAQPRGLWLLLACVALDYAAMQGMALLDKHPQGRRFCVTFCFAKNLGFIVWSSAMVEIYGAEARLGLLIYTLTGLDTVLCAYRREMPIVRNPVTFALHCCFFPKLYAGPLVEYRAVREQMIHSPLQPHRLIEGAGEFVHGAVKNLVLGGGITVVYRSIRNMAPEEATVLSTWCLVIALAFSVYFTLSGFCDMAKGIAAMFGIKLPANFYYPYQSRSVEDFFNRFNITVNQYFRRTVYRSLQEDKNGPAADALNILVIGMLMGLWFGFHVNYLLWGLYLGSFIILEKYLYKKVLQATPTLFCRVYALCVVLSSFTIFAGNSARQSLGFIRDMFGFGGLEAFNEQILYLLSSNWLLLVLCVFFSTSLTYVVSTWMRKLWPRVSRVLLAAVDAAILLALTALAL